MVNRVLYIVLLKTFIRECECEVYWHFYLVLYPLMLNILYTTLLPNFHFVDLQHPGADPGFLERGVICLRGSP